MPSDKRDAAHRLLARLRREKLAETAGLRYTRRARLRGEAASISNPAGRASDSAGRAADAVVGRVAGHGALASGPVEVPGPMAWPRSIDRPQPLLGRKRAGIVGPKGVVALAVCLVLVTSAAMASLPILHNATAANNATGVAAASASPSGSPSNPPSDSPSPSPQATASTPATVGPRVGTPIAGSAFLAYRVRAGDTLSRIATSFGLSVTTLYWANSTNVADPQLVKIGQILNIPPMDGLAISVASGTTMQSIADKYGIDVKELAAANNMTDPTLVPGEMLLVPGADTPPLPVKQAPVPVVNWLGKLLWPAHAHYTITQLFGCTGWYGEPRWGKCLHFHDGLDIGGPTGVPVVAAAAGTVIYAGWRKRGTDGAAGGIVVWISHGGGTLYTTYNHLSAVTVKIGQKVTAGQRVGNIGETGAAAGTHLHFEVWVTYPWAGGDISGARNPLLYTSPKH